MNASGSYSIASNTWNADAEAWNHEYDSGSFVTFDSESLAVTTMAGFSAVTTATSAVPKPTTLLMMGVGALALMARRRTSA